MGVRFADFIYFFLNIPWKWKKNGLRATKLFHFHSKYSMKMRPNYFIFKEYLKMRDREWVRANPWTPLWTRHCLFYQLILESIGNKKFRLPNYLVREMRFKTWYRFYLPIFLVPGCSMYCLIWFFTSHQQSFSYIGTGLPGSNQY